MFGCLVLQGWIRSARTCHRWYHQGVSKGKNVQSSHGRRSSTLLNSSAPDTDTNRQLGISENIPLTEYFPFRVVIPNCKDLPSKCASLRFNCIDRRPLRSSSFSHKITPEDARLLGRVIFFRDDGASLRHPGITGIV